MLKNGKEYFERLKRMRPNIYMGGRKVDRTDERLQPGIYVIGETFNLANDPSYEKLCTATSHLSGERINRFCHIHQSIDDLIKKQEMTRALCHRTGGCIQRCMGVDALNALSIVTHSMDMALGTEIYPNFLNYLKYFQKNDLVAACAQTDAKGDRLKRPHEQEDPDLYLRIIESRPDGIVVRGAKNHASITPYADEIIVTPTRLMTDKDADYAVSFAIPADKERVKILSLTTSHHKRDYLEAPISRLGDAQGFVIFDDVFVPRERVFMDGKGDPRQVRYAGFLALLFALFHRHSYTGCKPAMTEIIASASALVAEYNGIEKEAHVREKISHLICIAELVYAAGKESAYRAEQSSAGTFIPDEVLTNAARKMAGESIYDEYKILADLAGGLCATIPLEKEFFSDETAELANKYLKRNPRISPEQIHRCFRGIQNLVASDYGAFQQVGGIHGGGSPQMESIAMMARYDLEGLKGIAKYLFGIEKELSIYLRPTVTPRKILEREAKRNR